MKDKIINFLIHGAGSHGDILTAFVVLTGSSNRLEVTVSVPNVLASDALK